MVVTVTYGNRQWLVEETVERTLAAGAGRVIVVLNGASEGSRIALSKLPARYPVGVIRLVHIMQNLGSAEGYRAGIAAALNQQDMDFIWLMDDDNWPAPDALSHAHSWHARLERSCNGEVAVACYRRHLEPHVRLRRGVPVDQVYPLPGAALNFDIRDRLSKWRHAGATRPLSAPVEVPLAPYGGLLMHREAVLQAGLPLPELVLYADDYEYTNRLRRAGVRIFFCGDAVISDSDGAQDLSDQPRGIVRRLRTPKDAHAKLYYQVRNDVYLDKQRATSSGTRIFLHINLTIYVVALICLASANRSNRTALSTTLAAIHDGWRGRLGLRFPLA